MSSPTTHSKTVDEGTFIGANGLTLFYRSQYPSLAHTGEENTCKVKGVLALVHGLGEHSGRYGTVFESLTEAGYAVFSFDNQGHGRSQGQRGHISSWQDYRDNLSAFLKLVRKQAPTAPLFVMGHSLGGLIVLDYILQTEQSNFFDIQGVVISAPPVQPCNDTVSRIRVLMARFLSGLFPRFSVKIGLDQSGLSRQKQVANDVANDPLNHPYVTLRWGSEIMKTIEWVRSHISQLQTPILLVHGDADPIMNYQGSCTLFEEIESNDKTLKIYAGSYHEPHNDLDAAVEMRDIVDWLEQHL